MYSNLRLLLASKNISIKKFADFLDVSEKTAQNKLNGATAFTYPEVCKIKEYLFPEYDLDYIFETKEEKRAV